MLPSRARLLHVLGYSAVGWLVLALLRTSLRVAAIPRPPAEALAVLGQVLLASLPWLLAAPIVVALARRLQWRRGSRVRTIGIHLVLVAAMSVADAAWGWLVLPPAGYPMTLPPAVFYLVRIDQVLFLYLCLVAIGLALRHRRRSEEASSRAARLEARLLDARLHVLELQLHPHFLFNALNAVSELVHRDAVAARAMLTSLRELLARTLEPGAGAIPLREELALLDPYVGIQRTRFAGSLEVVIETDPEALGVLVPRLVLQPLVENAIRHGTARRAGTGRVVVRSRTEGGRLVIEVEDDGLGLDAGSRREGVGLGNTRARLAQLYGEQACLRLTPARGRGAVARLECPIQRGPDSSPMDLEETASEEDFREMAPAAVSHVGLAIAAAWLLVAIAGAHADLVASRLMGDPATLMDALPARLLEAFLWLGLTGPVVWLASRLAASDLGWRQLLAVHVLVSVAAAAAHLGLVRVFSMEEMGGNLVATLLVNDLCVYAALAAGAHAWTMRETAATRAAAVARLDAELAAARLELLRWQMRPEVLFGALDRIAALAAEHPDRADELTGRLGELLRLMLRPAAEGRRDRPVEVELSEAYHEVETAARSVA